MLDCNSFYVKILLVYTCYSSISSNISGIDVANETAYCTGTKGVRKCLFIHPCDMEEDVSIVFSVCVYSMEKKYTKHYTDGMYTWFHPVYTL